MQRVQWLAVLLSILLGFASFALEVHAATPIGSVAAASGTARAEGPGGDRALAAGSTVFENDKIIVRNAGNAQIVLRDNTRLVVGPGSSLVLDRFVLRGGNTASRVSVKALRGTFRFISGKSAKTAYDIETPSATIGIRGTGFDFYVKGQTVVAVVEGTVELCSRNSDDTSRRCVELDDSCEVGRANNDNAAEYAPRNAAQNIRNNLPYLTNQVPLRKNFQLPIARCNKVLAALPDDNRALAQERSDSRLPPPPPPQPPPTDGPVDPSGPPDGPGSPGDPDSPDDTPDPNAPGPEGPGRPTPPDQPDCSSQIC